MPIRVLHIEDNLGDAVLLRDILRSADDAGFVLTHASRLSVGLANLAAEPFDVVLLDMSLPESRGIATFEQVREKFPHIPVIVLSGLDDEAAAMQTVLAGAQDYLCKDELNARMLPRAIRNAIQRHRTDEALEEERRLLRSLIDALPDQIYVKDCQSKFVACNTATANMMGLDKREAIVGKSDFDFFPHSLAEKFCNEEIAVLSGQPRVNREERIENPSGEPRWLLTTKVPLYDTAGKIHGLVGINRDITERKQVENRLVKLHADLRETHEDLKAAQLQLIQAEKMESVGRLAAGVAHEVKNPLAVAVMGLEYLKNTLGSTNPSVSQVLTEIHEAIKRADTVIGGLLDFSRPRTLLLKLESLNELIEQSAALVRHDLAGKRIRLVQNLAQGLPSIRVDGNKFKQVFINLFTNAIHAMPEEGRLTVSTFAAKSWELRDVSVAIPPDKFGKDESLIVVLVEDTGSGISDEHLNKIFDPYFTTKSVGEGTGLGLPVSRQIVELHGGILDIRNRPEGGARAIVAIRAATGGTQIIEKTEL